VAVGGRADAADQEGADGDGGRGGAAAACGTAAAQLPVRRNPLAPGSSRLSTESARPAQPSRFAPCNHAMN
jgi:hypothetical protein